MTADICNSLQLWVLAGGTIHHKMEFVVMQDVLLKTDPTKGSFLKLRP